MGKKKAKKQSKIIDGEGSAVNVEVQNNTIEQAVKPKKEKKKKSKRKKRGLGRAEARTQILFCFLIFIGLILLHAILRMVRQQVEVLEALNRIGIGDSPGLELPAAIAIQIIERI